MVSVRPTIVLCTSMYDCPGFFLTGSIQLCSKKAIIYRGMKRDLRRLFLFEIRLHIISALETHYNDIFSNNIFLKERFCRYPFGSTFSRFFKIQQVVLSSVISRKKISN